MVDAVVGDKIFNCTDLRCTDDQDGRNSKDSGENRRKFDFDATTNTEEKTESTSKKEKFRTGVFVGRTSEENIPTPRVNQNFRWSDAVNDGYFGQFGRRRRGLKRNIPNSNSEGGSENDKILKTRHNDFRGIYEFFRGTIPAQSHGLRRITTANSVSVAHVPFTTIQDTERSREFSPYDVESKEVASDLSTDPLATTSGIDNVFGKFGDGGKCVVGMVETPKVDLSDNSTEYRKLGRETFVKYLGSTCRYISDICVPENSSEIVQFLIDVRQLSGSSITEQLRLVSVHDTHIHVVHTCAYSNSACRCTWLSGSSIWRNRRVPKHRRRVFAADISALEWEAIYRYFTTNGHAIQNFESGGSNARICIRLKNLQVKN